MAPELPSRVPYATTSPGRISCPSWSTNVSLISSPSPRGCPGLSRSPAWTGCLPVSRLDLPFGVGHSCCLQNRVGEVLRLVRVTQVDSTAGHQLTFDSR